jgi:hypothetical protein
VFFFFDLFSFRTEHFEVASNSIKMARVRSQSDQLNNLSTPEALVKEQEELEELEEPDELEFKRGSKKNSFFTMGMEIKVLLQGTISHGIVTGVSYEKGITVSYENGIVLDYTPNQLKKQTAGVNKGLSKKEAILAAQEELKKQKQDILKQQRELKKQKARDDFVALMSGTTLKWSDLTVALAMPKVCANSK